MIAWVYMHAACSVHYIAIVAIAFIALMFLRTVLFKRYAKCMVHAYGTRKLPPSIGLMHYY